MNSRIAMENYIGFYKGEKTNKHREEDVKMHGLEETLGEEDEDARRGRSTWKWALMGYPNTSLMGVPDLGLAGHPNTGIVGHLNT